MGDREGARTELQGLIEKRQKKYVSAVNIASGFAVLNETDEVFVWLEKALAERDSNLTWLNVDREFDYLHDDPRFVAILKNVNLPEAISSSAGGVSENATSPAEIDTRDHEVNPSLSRRTWIKLAVAAAAVILLAGGAYYLIPLLARGITKPVAKNTLIRLTDAPFDDASPAFTHDGRIRFSRFLDKQTLVTYVMNTDGTGMREQTEIHGLTSGVFSPDGTKAFYHKGPGDPNFYLANTDGSNERVMPFHPGNCQWSPDSKQLVYQSKSRDNSVENNSDIFIFTIDTGAITPVVESPFFDSDPSFSPDGKSIVYASDVEANFEIYTKVIATGETKRVTHNLGHDSFPSFSPDGTQIIFNSDMEKENNDVYLMNVDGSDLRKMTDGPGWDASPPNCWSPDGTQVLLLSDNNGGKENIYLMNIEPYAPHRIDPKIVSDQPLDPAYAPDGEKIVYTLPTEIRILDTRSQTDRLVYKIASAGSISFSPDGSKLLFQARIEENTEICSVNIDGSGFTNITENPSRDMAPAYSPDGTRIAFSASRASGTSTFELYVMNADGSDPRLVFGDRAISSGPAWSPDGKTIVFANDREGGRIGNFELFSVSVDGGPERRLTDRPRYDVDPAFSPDGNRIAFVSNTDGNAEIYVMNADGSGVLRLTRDAGNDLYPHWSPDGKKLIFTSDRSGKYGMYAIDL
jgi:Tol biopolymer transport system component